MNVLQQLENGCAEPKNYNPESVKIYNVDENQSIRLSFRMFLDFLFLFLHLFFSFR